MESIFSLSAPRGLAAKKFGVCFPGLRGTQDQRFALLGEICHGSLTLWSVEAPAWAIQQATIFHGKGEGNTSFSEHLKEIGTATMTTGGKAELPVGQSSHFFVEYMEKDELLIVLVEADLQPLASGRCKTPCQNCTCFDDLVP